MRERIQFLFIYFGFWVVYFLCARVVFLAYHIDETKLLTLETLAGIFWNGIRMDMSMAGYLSIIPFLWVSFSNFIKKSVFETSLFSYTLILVFVITFLIVVDLEVYNVWDYRLDATPLRYLNTPREAWASVRSSPMFRLFISYIILLIIASYFVYRIIANKINSWNFTKKWRFIPWALLLTASLIIPIRGGLGKSPMNQSTVYFSENNFANISAVNACWNFFNSLTNRAYNKVNPYAYLPKDEIEKAMKELFQTKGNATPILNESTTPPNVLIVVWESFTEKVVDQYRDSVEITPNFNRLKHEGLYFPNTYASGDRTDKGLVAILSGYPAQPTQSIIDEPGKTEKLPILTKDFQKHRYRGEFYYGGETEFANIKSYLFTADFDQITDLNDFNDELLNTQPDVQDENIFNRFLEDHQSEHKDPFFATILTISSHEPFDVPGDTAVISGDDEVSLFLNALHYTDKEFGKFIEAARKQKWWDNTLVIVLGDHGHRLPETGNKADNFKIPMLWTGGAVAGKQTIDRIVSQTSVARSLLESLSFDASDYHWSRNIFRPEEKQWAYFSFNDGFGFIEPNKVLLFDNVGKREINSSGEIGEKDLNFAKALQQKSFQDYLDK